jgi:transcriptional regulator with XRE-family HTH domain
MVNTAEFKKALIDANISQRQLARMSGISKNALNRKINNHGDFTLTETRIICECLNITDTDKKCLIFLS